VEDNILSVMQVRGFSKEYQKEKLESLISEFGLGHIRKSLGIQLSGGERRRTEIARALAVDPKFILLDEPFAGVDPIAVEDIQGIVAKLKNKNIGILITDHNVDETLAITDRAYLLYDGRILQAGTPEDLANDPEVRRVYLGKNFVLRRPTRNEKGEIVEPTAPEKPTETAVASEATEAAVQSTPTETTGGETTTPTDTKNENNIQ
jgi:lipopolysaccharide export system ATP-binding protein